MQAGARIRRPGLVRGGRHLVGVGSLPTNLFVDPQTRSVRPSTSGIVVRTRCGLYIEANALL